MAATLSVSIAATVGLAASEVSAQRRPPGGAFSTSGGVLAPFATPGAPESAASVVGNPADVALVGHGSIGGVHSEARDVDTLEARGDGVYLVLPLAFGLAAAGAVERSVPGASTGIASSGSGTFALAAAAPSRKIAAGLSAVWVGSEDVLLGQRVMVNLGMSYRPSSAFAFGFALRNLVGPADLSGIGPDRSGALAAIATAALRPTGTRALTLDAGVLVDTDGSVAARAGAALAIPYVGSLVGTLELTELDTSSPALTAWAGVEVTWGRASVGGGVLTGDGFGRPGWYVTGELRGALGAPGARVPSAAYAREIEIGGLAERDVIDLAVEVDSIARDPNVAGVVLKMRGADFGMAYAQELRAMIARLRGAGKRVVCHVDSGSGSLAYACAQAHATFLDPAGSLRLVGPSSEVLLFGELLASQGVRGEFLRIGDYKSAPEQLTNRESSSAAREEREALLDDAYGRLVADLGADLGRTAESVRALIDRGPYLSATAATEGLVDGLADDLDLDRDLEAAFGERLVLRDEAPAELSRRWAPPGRVGVVVVEGTMVDGENVDIPLLDVHLTGGRTVAEAIDTLASDSSVKVILLRVDSPGGSVLAADQIWRALARAREAKPVIVSMGAVAASGGYYVASAGSEIWADATTLTGSIGIFYGKVDLEALAGRIGVTVDVLSRGAHAGMESLWRPLDAEERLVVADGIRTYYRLFLQRISEGRAMEIDEIDRVARGRVWSGEAAQARQLVDRLGGFADALVRARELGHLPDDADVVVVPKRPSSLLDYVRGDERGSTRSPDPIVASIPAALRRAVIIALTLSHTAAGVPMALETEHSAITVGDR